MVRLSAEGISPAFTGGGVMVKILWLPVRGFFFLVDLFDRYVPCYVNTGRGEQWTECLGGEPPWAEA